MVFVYYAIYYVKVYTVVNMFLLEETSGWRSFRYLLYFYMLSFSFWLGIVYGVTKRNFPSGINKGILNRNRNLNFALTTDIWSSRTCEPYMSLTIHFIEDWEMKTAFLQTSYFPQDHTGAHVAEALTGCTCELEAR